MYFISLLMPALMIFFLGLLGAASFVLFLLPESKQLHLIVSLPQGLFGLLACLVGLWQIFFHVIHVTRLMDVPLYWFIMFIGGGLFFILGALLVAGAVMNLMRGSAKPEAAEKMKGLLRKIYIVDALLGAFCMFYALVRVLPVFFGEGLFYF